MNPTPSQSHLSPIVLGVLNVTPDSFSDGGKYTSLEQAIRRSEQLVSEGADFVDVGGESTRPGAGEVSVAVELARVLPVVETLVKRGYRVSIDTRKFEVARAAVEAGATVVNDVTGGADPRLPSLAREGVSFLLMHMQGEPGTMQKSPSYPNGVVTEIRAFFEERVSRFVKDGVRPESIWIDPGIGFGKTLTHNLECLRGLAAFSGIAGRIAIGTSRKSFLSRVLGIPDAPMEAREAGTIASNLFAYALGASVFRVHEPGPLRRALTTWQAMEGALP